MQGRLKTGILGVVLGLAAEVVIGIVLSLQAGTLEPPPEAAPGGTPVPTMKNLDEIPPSWSRTLPADDGDPVGCGSSRFDCVMSGAAVLDKETGLVWEQSPATTDHQWGVNQQPPFDDAGSQCTGRTTGDRLGWRLPSVHELASLVDPNNLGGGPRVPPGHPFIGVQSAGYWSATTWGANSAFVWVVDFSTGRVGVSGQLGPLFVWCVRGDMNADQY